MDKQTNISSLVSNFVFGVLEGSGEDVSREGLIETPGRVYRMYQKLLSGYSQDPSSIFKTFSSNGYKGLITVSNINFYSLCEHHMIPFYGKVHVGYLPNGKILGLSKFARLVDIFSKRVQTQENLTCQVADAIEKYLKPRGFIIRIEAEHLCMAMRGVKKNGCITNTMEIRGVIKNKPSLINQFNGEIRLNKSNIN
ncbi:GTP cyclohydrolase I FolE [Patescibacteria group bacterium]|nr:GTP cyclohydrolase I FolE [Patescibacteria group bacterium]